MDPYRYPYGYHPAPPPVDPGGVTPITTNQQGVAMMAPQGYISAAPSPAYPVYYGGAGAVPLGGSVPPVATVPSTWGMHYGPGMAGVEYPAVTAMPGAYPTAGPVTTRELTQFPSPGSESVSTTYMPYASRGEFVSLASGNFYALWSGHGWRRVPGCDRYAGCLSDGRACDHARTNAVPVSWVRVCLDHVHALCLQGWVRLPGVGKFRLAVRRALADFPAFSHTHVRWVRPQLFIGGSMFVYLLCGQCLCSPEQSRGSGGTRPAPPVPPYARGVGT